MLLWKKIWTWIKHHWYWPVILILLAFSVFSGTRSRKKLFNLLEEQKKNYEKEIEIIEKTNEEANKKKTEIFVEHVEELEKIEDEHKVKLEELEVEKRKELVEIIEQNKNRPDKLAEEVAKVLSAEFLKKGGEDL